MQAGERAGQQGVALKRVPCCTARLFLWSQCRPTPCCPKRIAHERSCSAESISDIMCVIIGRLMRCSRAVMLVAAF